MSHGVLNQVEMLSLLSGERKSIHGWNNTQPEPGESTIDLPLGDHYYEMRASCRPQSNQAVASLIRSHKKSSQKQLHHEGVRFEPNHIYLIPIPWELKLPQNIRARATAKSTIGRLDVLVRLVTDRQSEFDRIDAGVFTKLYVEVVPLTFPIIVRPNKSLSQLRFIQGDPEQFVVPSDKLRYQDIPVLVDREGKAIQLEQERHREGVLLTLDLKTDKTLQCVGLVAKMARRNKPHEPIDPWMEGQYSPTKYWEKVKCKNGIVEIERDRFYIFRSKERFRIPPNLAVECQAYSESLGDIRIHYAGFAHPWFGFKRSEGTPLIFEVRGFSVNTILWDEAPLAKVHFWKMSKDATPVEAPSYGDQELNLSKCFKEWPQVRKKARGKKRRT